MQDGDKGIEIEVLDSEKVWSSPDGQRTIWKVKVAEGPDQITYSTFSGNIGNVDRGTRVTVECYNRDGRDGPERFIRPVKEEGKTYGNSGGSSNGGGGQRQQRSSGGGSNGYNDPSRQRSIVAQSMLKAAVEHLKADPSATPDKVCQVADYFVDWHNDKVG